MEISRWTADRTADRLCLKSCLKFHQQEKFKPEIAMLFTVDFFLLSLNMYSFLCVVSQYQEYKAGRGRAVDEDNIRRQFAPVRYLAQPTATSVLSTRRGTHTTVHDGHSPSADRELVLLGVNGEGRNSLNGAATAIDVGENLGGLRLIVPPPPYSRRPQVQGPGVGPGSVRKHVKFPDNARIVLHDDSSPGDSPGTGPCGFMEENSTGTEWPLDEKALLSAT